MPLSDAQLRYYDSNVLRLPKDARAAYNKQVDNLVAELGRSLRDKKGIRITQVVKAGSFAKHTILRKTAADRVDVDVVVYISGRDVDKETLSSLSDAIHELLVELYPSKSVEDFEIQRTAATVTFVGTGLSVDVVPVIEDPRRPGYGWQFDIKDGSRRQTCAPCQIKFVRDRKDRDPDFRTLVRMAKRWRTQAELVHLKSFPVELIMAHLIDTQGSASSIEQRFRNFLLYIAQSGLKEQIRFPENGVVTNFTDPVVIVDPVCDSNNVTSRLTESERQEIVGAALDAWECANYASASDNVDMWKEVFGPRFRIEE